jgi:hypothetical protein
VAGERLSLEDILELEHEAFAEIGNIILNACIATVANLPRRSLSMSLPEIIRCTSQGLFDLGDSKADDVVLFVHINFSLKGHQVVGYVAMVMDFASLESLKELVTEFISRMTEQGRRGSPMRARRQARRGSSGDYGFDSIDRIATPIIYFIKHIFRGAIPIA